MKLTWRGMEVIPFDIDKWETGKYKVVTRDGKEVSQLTRFVDVERFPLRGALNRHLESWELNGNWSGNGDTDWDLFLAAPEPKKEVRWVNFYQTGTACHYPTEEAADRQSTGARLYGRAIRVEVLEESADRT